MDVDPGASTNRTVYTFVGTPGQLFCLHFHQLFVYILSSFLLIEFFFITDRIVEGALNAAKAAFPLIDMTKHKGEHPRYF